MVPSGWEKCTLENHINIKHGFAFKSKYFKSEGHYVLMTPGSFFETGGFKNQGIKTKYYVGEFPSSYLLKKDDLLLAMTEQATGLLGSAALTPENNKFLHNQRLGLVKPITPIRVSISFLYWLYNSPYIRKQISEQSTGTKVKHTSPDKLRGVTTLLPPLPEQRKIAQILSTWDKAISTTESLIANSQQQKKALMQQLLTGKKRFAEFEGKWERHSLSSLAFIDRNSLGKNTASTFQFRYISLSDVHTGTISDNLEKHHFETSPSRARRKVSNGDILLATVRPNLQGFAKIGSNHNDCIASTGFSVLTSKKNVCGNYLYHYLFGAHIKGQIEALVVGSNYPAINSSDVSGLKVYCPLHDEQKKIASVLTAADQEIDTLQQKLSHLKQEKKALMQQLLTGKRRVMV